LGDFAIGQVGEIDRMIGVPFLDGRFIADHEDDPFLQGQVFFGDTPDLLPTIAALGAAAEGTTRITDCEHVRLKETDRVAAMASELEKMGVDVEEHEDELVVHGGRLEGATVEGYEDHRIIMALATAALVADGETTIEGADHVDVSFPDFFEVLYDLGADVER
jgi:3-phosphoshikimate 1-carboxyvinyltransferase